MYTEPLDVDALDPEPATYDGTKAYARCKRAQVVLAEEWTRELLDTDVAVNAMHPGWADTPGLRAALPGFSRHVGPLPDARGKEPTRSSWLAAAPEAEDFSGQFFLDRRARAKPRLRRTRRPDAAREAARLWRACAERTAPFTARQVPRGRPLGRRRRRERTRVPARRRPRGAPSRGAGNARAAGREYVQGDARPHPVAPLRWIGGRCRPGTDMLTPAQLVGCRDEIPVEAAGAETSAELVGCAGSLECERHRPGQPAQVGGLRLEQAGVEARDDNERRPCCSRRQARVAIGVSAPRRGSATSESAGRARTRAG